MNTRIHIRAARPSDATVLTEIAYESKRYWGYPDDWMALWRDALTITPDYLSEHIASVAEIESAAVAFYALSGEGTNWQLDHLWVLPAWMGRGIGGQLFRHASARLATLAPGAIIGIESDPNAEPFYVHMGARRVGDVVSDWQGVRRVLPYMEFEVSSAALIRPPA